jgi:hypothetical protein
MKCEDFVTENIEIRGVRIHDFDESIIASGYPMQTSGMTVNDKYPTQKQMDVAKNLAKSAVGSGHDQFMTGILVSFDLTLPVQVWGEVQRYNWIAFVSSGSKMHALAKADLGREAFDRHVALDTIMKVRGLAEAYNANKSEENFLKLVMNCPLGFKLTARMTTNYRQLKTIYYQRKNHRLPHWRDFCNWILTLEGMKDFLGVE